MELPKVNGKDGCTERIEVESRRVHVLGITAHSTGPATAIRADHLAVVGQGIGDEGGGDDPATRNSEFQFRAAGRGR